VRLTAGADPAWEERAAPTVYGTPPTVERASIEVVSLRGRSRKTIVRGGTSARYLPSGHLVYTNGNTMFAVPFDLDTLETRGTAVPVLDDVAFDAAAGLAQFDVSRDGTLVYRRGSGSGRGVPPELLRRAAPPRAHRSVTSA
jgi:hypothetical protein